MRMRWLCVIPLVLSLIFLKDGLGEEQYLEFLNGLRDRQLFDSAEFYLDRLEKDSSVPKEIRELIPFERAVTALESAGTLPDPELQNKQLDRALQLLGQFVKASPNHSKAAEANSERGRIFLGKARVQNWQAQSPSNQASRKDFQEQARQFVNQARKIYQTAHDQYFALWEKFPRFIDEQEDREQFEKRRDVEIALLRAELNLGLCTYEEAQTYDRGSENYRKLLTKASTEFEAIHTKYRSQVGGLYARMWQGKCFEEQNEIRKALGIYDELLDHPGTSGVMKSLQNQVLQFRLICLNHDKRRDYALAIVQSDEWLAKNRGAVSRSSVGLGIRWEQAIAQEKLAEQREQKLADKDRLLRAALNNMRFINRYPGQYKDVSIFKIRELMAKVLGSGATQDPEDFDTAYGLARDMVKKIKEMDAALDAARKAKKKRDEITKLQQQRRRHLEETARMLRLALTLTEPETPLKDVNQTRYLLAYTNYLLRNSYEAAILGEYVAQHYGKDEGALVAMDCAYLALAAFVQAYNDSSERQKDADMQSVVRVGTLLTKRWPKSDRADDTRMQLGQVYRERKQPAESGKWYAQVPTNSERYPEAQLAAGQAYWAAYLHAGNLPEEERPAAKQLKEWHTAAEKHLRTGIMSTEKLVAKDAATPSDLTSAKATLAQILLSNGAYQPCLDLLAKDPHSVIKAMSVKDESKRPKTGGVQSVEFASLVFQLQLRAYVGLQKLNEARATMKKLETLAAGTAGNEAVTAVYIELGKQLQDELKRLKGIGEEKRWNEVRNSFESFLTDMFKRKEQTFGSLVWIAETYFGLAEGSVGDDKRAKGFFEKAGTAYEEILKRAEKTPEFVNEGTRFAAQIRLVTCRRRQQAFEQALNLAAELVAANLNSLEAQMEASLVLQDWGLSGQGDSEDLLRKAMMGGSIGPNNTPCWGWGQMSLNIQRLLETGTAADWDKYETSLYEARYNAVFCRYRYGLKQSTEDGMTQELERAKFELLTFASIVPDRISSEWWNKFDRLYQDIQKDLGEEPVALEKPKEPVRPEPAVASTAVDVQPQAAKAKTSAPAKAGADGPGLGFIIFAIVLSVGGVVAVVFMVKSQMRPQRRTYAGSSSPVLPKARSAAQGKSPTKTARSKPKGQAAAKPKDEAASKSKGEAAAKSQEKPATKPKGEASQQKPDKRQSPEAKPKRPPRDKPKE